MVVLLCFSEKERVSGSPGWPEEKDINGSNTMQWRGCVQGAVAASGLGRVFLEVDQDVT